MLIKNITLHTLKAPLHTPFKTAVRTVSSLHDTVVRIECEDGLVGYGSAPSTPAITQDDHASIASAITTELSEGLIGQSIDDFGRLIKQIHYNTGAGRNAKAAVDVALYDLLARYRRVPLFELLAPAHIQAQGISTQLMTDYTISINDIQEMLNDIDTALKRGYRCLKVKIGTQASADLFRIQTIYDHVASHPEAPITLRLDANQGWDADTTIKIMQALEAKNMHFELIEQPVRASDIDGLKQIKAAIKTPLMADESAFNLTQVKTLHLQSAADIINIKLVKTGGLYGALEIVKYCRQHNLPCMIGCMLEGSIGVAAAAHLALANPDVIQLIDLDGPTLATIDPIKGASTFHDAHITINQSFGLGISAQQALQNWSAD
jgi:L-alanine-DL-glutamate epimerase-like enolase superfamily enzyme